MDKVAVGLLLLGAKLLGSLGPATVAENMIAGQFAKEVVAAPRGDDPAATPTKATPDLVGAIPELEYPYGYPPPSTEMLAKIKAVEAGRLRVSMSIPRRKARRSSKAQPLLVASLFERDRPYEEPGPSAATIAEIKEVVGKMPGMAKGEKVAEEYVGPIQAIINHSQGVDYYDAAIPSGPGFQAREQ